MNATTLTSIHRFVLLDAFVRFLANALLAAICTIFAIRIVFHPVIIDEVVFSNPIYTTGLIFGFCLLLIVFALVRGQIEQWLTKVVFRRTDEFLQEIHSRGGRFQDESEFLQWAAELLAQFVSADRVEHQPGAKLGDVSGETDLLLPVPASDLSGLRNSPELAWVEAIVPLRFGQGDVTYVLLGRRRGGRRYLRFAQSTCCRDCRTDRAHS